VLQVANQGIFIGFGNPVRGREGKSLEIFNEAMQYYARLEEAATIESWEVALLEPHGGELGGFFLLRGQREKLSELRGDAEFRRLTTRASLIVDQLGVVNAALGEGLSEEVSTFQEAIAELT
jgi:hypothetical protein